MSEQEQTRRKEDVVVVEEGSTNHEQDTRQTKLDGSVQADEEQRQGEEVKETSDEQHATVQHDVVSADDGVEEKLPIVEESTTQKEGEEKTQDDEKQADASEKENLTSTDAASLALSENAAESNNDSTQEPPPLPLKGEEESSSAPAPPSAESKDSKTTTITTTTTTNDEEVAHVARAFGVRVGLKDDNDEEPPSSGAVQSHVEKAQTAADPIIEPSASSAAPATPMSATAAKGKSGGLRIGKGPPPTTQASEEKPFDFNRFLEQMRHRSASPVGEYVRSFIKGFTKKPYRVADQTKLILDFLDFIALRMRECEVWASMLQSEFDNSIEAMEKLIMNRLYNFTFSPAIKREGKWSVQTDDLERDRVLKQRIRLFGWIDESHLDVPVGDHSKGFVDFAIQELLKINHYKAPRDKLICILNCCKVIFGLIRHLSTQENADTFVPILIFVVLRANPDNLISNVEYISRFRNPDRLSSESGYYLSSLMGAVAFIETMDYTSLSNITQQEFEANVEKAVQSMSAQSEAGDQISPARPDGGLSGGGDEDVKSGSSSAQMTPQSSVSSHEDGGARSLPISTGATALAKDTKAFIARTGEAARVGIGASFGGGMSALGRLFQDGLDGPRTPLGTSPGTSASATGGASGFATPDSSAHGGTGHPQAAGSARQRMWNLFGVDEDQVKDQKAIRQKETTSSGGARNTSGPTLNFGSWGRNLRAEADSEPPTPQSEELRQGRFAPLSAHQPTSQPLSERLARSFETRTPRTPLPPVRRESTDPYMIDAAGHGVQTPTDDGSEVGDEREGDFGQRQVRPNDGGGGGLMRSRPSDLSSFLPSFLTDVGLVRTPQGSQSPLPPSDDDRLGPPLGSPMNTQMNDEQAAQAAAQIDRAHLDAGVDTLKSIFPDMERGVCRLVLEGCGGDVQASIDKLLEMT